MADASGPEVKERSEPTDCLGCGRPTWSSGAYCIRCRTEPTAPSPIAPPTVPVPPPLPTAGRREVEYDEAGRIAEDIPCRRCGYNLRGLDPRSACPECSTAVGRSIHGDLLQFCDPSWLERVARGLRLIIIGILADIGFGIVSVGVIAAFTTPNVAPRVAAAAISAGISLIMVLGVWLLTTPDPGQPPGEPSLSARRLARWCMTAQVAGAPLQMIGNVGWGNPMTALTLSLAITMAAAMALGIVVLVGNAAGLIYLRKLALRIPGPSLARQTAIGMWGYVSSGALGTVVGIAYMLMMPRWMAPGGAPGIGGVGVAFAALGGCVVGLGSLVFGIWILVLLFLYGGALGRTAAQARATWARASE